MPNLIEKSWTISILYRVRILLDTYSTVYRYGIKTLLLFSFGTFDSFQAEIESSTVQTAHKPLLQSRQQVLRAYCPKI